MVIEIIEVVVDPAPERESSEYKEYIEELQEIERQVSLFYKGFHQSPILQKRNT